MSMEETLGQAAAGADPTAALSNAVRRVRQAARSAAEAAHAIVTSRAQSASDLEAPIAAFQARVADFQSFTVNLDALLESQQGHERQLVSQLDALREADQQRAAEHQRLGQRLYRTQEALRYANASGEALRQVDRLLRQEVLKVTDCIQTPMLQDERRSAHFDAAWFEFLESGRLSPSVDMERALRDASDEPLPLVTARSVPQCRPGTNGNARRQP